MDRLQSTFLILKRREWIDFVCSDHHPGRFLSSFGDVQLAGAELDIADAALRVSAGASDVRLLATAVHLLTEDNVSFFGRDVRDFIRTLQTEIRREVRVVGPALRGRPIWHRTVLGRLAGSVGAARYVASLPDRRFDTPENLVVVALLHATRGALDRIADRVGSGRLHRSLTGISDETRRALRDVNLRQIVPPSRVDTRMHTRAQRHRNPLYGRASVLLARLGRLAMEAESSRWAAILDLLRARWLEPVSDDDLFELFVLVLTMDVLQIELGLGAPFEYGLVAAGRRHVAAYHVPGGGRLKVYFDQSPSTIFGERSRYAEVRARHVGVTGGERRPDIVLDLAVPGKDRTWLMIEVKRTSDGRYASDSIYKVFGYLWDFAGMLPPGRCGPRAVLVFPEQVAPRDEAIMSSDLLLVSSDQRNKLAAVLAACLKLVPASTSKSGACWSELRSRPAS